jgi:Pectic acid lyase
MRYLSRLVIVLFVFLAMAASARAQQADQREQASAALRKAVEFFRKNVATEGGYLWRYSADLSKREGEGKATATQIWVQPPGTPAVGLAYLAAYHATGDTYYLDAARETAGALIKGQLRSGGWTYQVEFDPALRKKFAFRIDPPNKGRNYTTYDDNTTQSAVRLLARLDVALKQKDAKIHEAATVALEAILKSQYPNGAWPQGFAEFPDPAMHPVKKANYYTGDYPRAMVKKEYWSYYTLNDNLLADLVDVLFEASRLYGDAKFSKAAEKAGDFLILAQMPEPQPGWAQQYDEEMRPSWARKFEPPSITGGESQGVMQTLLRFYRETGDKKYLEPLPKALAYYKKSLLSDGRLARFYELKTNKPLYFTKTYELTFKDNDLPTHYGFKVGSRLDAIEREYERLKKLSPDELKKQREPSAKPSKPGDRLIAQTKSVIAALDKEGRWVEDGKLRFQGPNDPNTRIISCETFIRNVTILSNYLAASRAN